MALNVGDILTIADVQTLFGQTVMNIYTYEVSSLEVDADYEDVATAFNSGIVSAVDNIQCNDVTHTSVMIKNITNMLDIFEGPLSETGDLSGISATSLVAWGFRLNRTTALTRHGSKRIAGVPEGQLAGNNPESTFLATLDTFATALATPISRTGTVDHDIELRPVIVGRITTPGPTYGEYDISKINPVASAQFVRVTSQTTRRAGRGT